MQEVNSPLLLQEKVRRLGQVRQATAVLEPFVPEPAVDFTEIMEIGQAAPRRRPSPFPIPHTLPFLFGSRFVIWKQDPSVKALGRRLTYVPGLVLNGPRDARIDTALQGATPVHRHASGDFTFRADTPEADCAHTFAVARQTLTMFERALAGTRIPWAWNSPNNATVITVHPRGFASANAFYSRNGKVLKFGYFTPQGGSRSVYTCRSLDIVAHETGHAVLDGLKPGWLGLGNPPQTGGLHESFGDLSAIFLALSQLDQVEAFVAMTKADLHAKNFLAALAEEFGSSLDRPMGLRNADNDLKLSQVSNEVHAISQVFTGAIYDILADIFKFEWRRQRSTKGPEHVLLDVSQHLCKLLLRAITQAPDVGATYTDVASQMLKISKKQSDPGIYRTFIRSRFALRDVVVPSTPLAEMAMAKGRIDFDNPDFADEDEEVLDFEPLDPNHASLQATQDRCDTCGTMQLPEYARSKDKIEADLTRLRETDEPIPEEDLLAEEVQELCQAFK